MPKTKRPSSGSVGEEAFALHCKAYGLEPVREFRFVDDRKWRLDFAFPAQRIGVEVEGGTWQMGRHQRGSGFAQDCVKYNRAAREGWRVLRYTTDMILSGSAIDEVRQTLERSEMSPSSA